MDSLMPYQQAVDLLGISRHLGKTEFRNRGVSLVKLGNRLFVYRDQFYRTYAEYLNRAGIPIPEGYGPNS